MEQPTQTGPIYLIVTGATTARRVPELLRALAGLGWRVLVVQTPNAAAVLAPRELTLALDALGRDHPHHVVESYFDRAILPRPAPGPVLVAPCSFNSLNKLALGLADNLALSITAEAIGRGWPVLVAPSLNLGLWQHPRARASLAALREWGVEIVEPDVVEGDPRLAATERLIAAVRRHL